MSKKLFSLIIVVCLLTSLFVGCGSKQNNTSAGGKKLKIAMITSAGGLGDRSFNDSGNEGLKRVKKELGIDYKIVEPKDISEGEKYLTELAKAGYDIVATLEYGHADIVKKIAPQYPKTTFAVFNQVVKGDNIVSVVFGEHEAAFLAGALSAMVTKDTAIKGMNADKKIGFIGGIQSPGIDKFLVGYQEGAKYIDPSIEVLSAYANNFGDPAKGKELALVQIEKGADIVFHAAGGTGEGVIDAAKSKGVFAIGVDSDQDYIAEGTVLTSVMKRVDNSFFELAKKLQDGKLKGGETLYMSMKDGGSQLSDMKFTKDKIKPEYLTKINEIKEKIIKGEIKVTDVTATNK